MTEWDDAIKAERQLESEAAEIRKGEGKLTAGLFVELWPLLRAPIPKAFLETTGAVKGKPYESTGIRSVQVQIDRMNNVLTPLWWADEAEYQDGGRLCCVTVSVIDPQKSGLEGGRTLLTRASWGGVDRASSTGNLYKGSYTNAAKVAFARIGPGHEVYLGATDQDPDVTGAAVAGAEPEGIGKEIAGTIYDRAKASKLLDRLRLAASHVAGADVGDVGTKAKATKALAGLSFEQAERVNHWIERKGGAEEQTK